MRLDLRNVLDVPGMSIPFEYELDVSDMVFDSIKIATTLKIKGEVINRAGVMLVLGSLSSELGCACARCLKEFDKHLEINIEAVLAEEIHDSDNDENIFLIEGNAIELDEIFLTAFVLNVDQRFLCDEECKGLCPKCGKDLNDGPCNCTADKDPRLAVLEQLLENEN